jgi:hypothetical protein
MDLVASVIEIGFGLVSTMLEMASRGVVQVLITPAA